MLCKQCKKNQVNRFTKLNICDSCYVNNFFKAHPKKYKYRYSGIIEEVFKRDNYKCVLCGNKKKILIHHIDGNGSYKEGKKLKAEEQNNRIENLVTLCYSCHNKIHRQFSGWSRKYEKCRECGTKKIPHKFKGLCQKCWKPYHAKYVSDYYKKNYDQIKKRKARWFQERGKYLARLRKINRG